MVNVVSDSSALIMLSPAIALKLAVGAVVSKVNVRLLSAEVLPALSVCFTQTVLLPSPVGALKLVPVPAVQVDLLSVLYCQLATSVAKLTLTNLLWVIKSVLELPVSLAKDKLGAATVVSKVNVNGVEVLEVLPAKSV